MANIIDGICPEGSILDGFDNWPRSATRKEWFRISLKAEEDKQYAAAVGAQKMLCELLLRRKMDNEAENARRPGWGYRHGNTRS